MVCRWGWGWAVFLSLQVGDIVEKGWLSWLEGKKKKGRVSDEL